MMVLDTPLLAWPHQNFYKQGGEMRQLSLRQKGDIICVHGKTGGNITKQATTDYINDKTLLQAISRLSQTDIVLETLENRHENLSTSLLRPFELPDELL